MGSRLVLVLVATLLSASVASAQSRRVEIRFSARRRAQIAVWIESADGTRFETLRLTDAVAYRGIGNRPGALMMNSARHHPYGRREGALPIWAHRRFEVEGDAFRRVIFNGRTSEGDASVSGDPFGANTPDSWFCLSFTTENNDIELPEDAFDTMTCASVFNSNKGRYITSEDVAEGYAEPWQDGPGVGRMRLLSMDSLYPPRRDLAGPACFGEYCEHDDLRTYAADALAVIPMLDAMSMATPAEGDEVLIVHEIADDWPDGEYVVFVEVNAEGDYAPGWDSSAYPPPMAPAGMWDIYAHSPSYGYAYRGQPSILYTVPVTIDPQGGDYATTTAAGYGELHGEDGDVRPIHDSIANDPVGSPGSGVDRLFADADGVRASVTVPPWDVCLLPEPPAGCGDECNDTRPCPPDDGLLCGPDHTCVDRCSIPMAVPAPTELTLANWPVARHQHEWATLRFVVPEVTRGLFGWEVRVGTAPIEDEVSFMTARQARAATRADEALVIPIAREDGTPFTGGEVVELELGGLGPLTTYHVGVRAFDSCNSRGAIATAEITTTPIQFTTVSPCFVATAAYGSPLDARLGVLRRFRDRHLLTTAPGRAFVAIYETVGPVLADLIRDDEAARAAVRTLLEPIIALLD